MTAPAVGAVRFGIACCLGLGLGLGYGFLRPLRKKHNALPDLIFVLIFGYTWLYHSFAVCRGDIRPAGFAGLLLGWWLWEKTAGKWLRPVFFGFWAAIRRVFAWIFLPARKIFEKIGHYAKKLFAYRKKSGKIKWKRNVPEETEKGGRSHGQTLVAENSNRIPSQQHLGEGGGAVRYRTVYGDTADHPWGHRGNPG